MRILAVIAWHTSILSPTWWPNFSTSYRNGAVSSQNITHSNNSSSQNWLMSDVSPNIIVSGVSPSNLLISWAVLDLIKASNSKQPSHKHYGALDHSSLWPTPFLSSLISLFPAFDLGVYGSNYESDLGSTPLHVTNACCWDTIPHKQQWQSIICLASGCHWESYIPSKICGKLVHICCPFWTLKWQILCLKIQDVPGNDNQDYDHLFCIMLTMKVIA